MLQATEKPLPDLPGVPLALSLARTDEARQLIRSGIIVPTISSRLYAVPPATPTDRVRTLRAAFIKTLSDPEFVAEARQAELDIDPIAGEEVERLIGELFRMPPPVHAKLKELQPLAYRGEFPETFPAGLPAGCHGIPDVAASLVRLVAPGFHACPS